MESTRLALAEISGTALACGREYGERFEPLIMGFCRQELKPDRRNLAYARRCWRHVERDAPESAAFMRGMARGSRLSLDHVTLLTLHEEIVHMPHCTAFAAAGPATRDGRTYVAMNWDWNSNLFPWPGLLRLAMKRSPRMLTYHYPGLWAGAGINESGLAFMWTGSGYLPRLAPVTGMPTYVIISEVLRGNTVDEVVEWLQSIRHAGSFIFFLGDAGGATAVVEGLPGWLTVDRKTTLTRANHYACDDVVRCAKQKIPRGGRVTTGYRGRRMASLLKQHEGGMGVEAARQILTDREGDWPWIHQYPGGRFAYECGGMTIDSLLAVCEERALYTCRGGRIPGPWQRVVV